MRKLGPGCRPERFWVFSLVISVWLQILNCVRCDRWTSGRELESTGKSDWTEKANIFGLLGRLTWWTSQSSWLASLQEAKDLLRFPPSMQSC